MILACFGTRRKAHLALFLGLLLRGSAGVYAQPSPRVLPPSPSILQIGGATLDLASAMALSDEHAFAVQQAQATLSDARQQEFFSFTQLGPTLSTEGALSWFDRQHTLPDTNNHNEGLTASTWSATVTQPLTGFLSGSARTSAAVWTAREADQKLAYQHIQARVDGAKAYVFLQQALRTLQAKQVASQSAAEAAKQSRVLFETGSVEKTKVDVLQTNAEAHAAQQQEIFAQRDVHKAVAALSYALGQPVFVATEVHTVPSGGWLVALETRSAWEKYEQSLATVRKDSLLDKRQRPDVQAAEAAYGAASKSLLASAFSFVPQVSTFASYARTTNDYGGESSYANANQFFYGFRVNWSLWDGGVQAAATTAAVSRKAQSRIAWEQTQQAADCDVESAYADLLASVASLEHAKQAVADYEEAYHLALIQYKTGDYSAINLIETQHKLTEVRVALAAVRSELDLSWVKVQAALGHLPRLSAEQF